MFKITYTLADGSERYDCVDAMATALFCAIECPIENAVSVCITGPDGFCQIWRLR